MDVQVQLQYLLDHINDPASQIVNSLFSMEGPETIGTRIFRGSFDWLPQITWGTDYLGKSIYAFKSFRLPDLGQFTVKRSVVFHFVEYTLIFIEATSGDIMLFLRDADTEAFYYMETYEGPLETLLNTENLIINTFNW